MSASIRQQFFIFASNSAIAFNLLAIYFPAAFSSAFTSICIATLEDEKGSRLVISYNTTTILCHGYLISTFHFFVTGLAPQSGYCLGLGDLYIFLEKVVYASFLTPRQIEDRVIGSDPSLDGRVA